MYKEYFKIAVKNLRTRQLRSWLTILGIVIGVFLVMSLMSLSQGLKDTVLKQLKAVGTDVIFVMPGSIDDIMTTMMGSAKLSDEDLNAIKKAEGVQVMVPYVYKGETVRYEGENKMALILGLDLKNADFYQNDMAMNIQEGRWPISGKKEVLIGKMVPADIFPGLKIGDRINIKGQQFEVTGILKSMGSKQDDSMIGIDLNIFRDITGEKKGAPQAAVKVAPGYTPEKVASNIKENLAQVAKKQIGQEDDSSYSVLTSDSLSDMVSSIMGILQAAVFLFASIAILVGGIGIMNTMYTSVRERTKEIGILKAVGAKNSTIVMIFLMEAGIIGVVGGIGGMIPGLALAKGVELVGQMHPIMYIKASITPTLIIFGLLFSFAIGCLSGFFPARSASKLKPVDALRYE